MRKQTYNCEVKKYTLRTLTAFTVFFSVCFLQATAQNKFNFRAAAITHFSYGKINSKENKIDNQPIFVQYPTRRNERNPFLDLDLQATYKLLKNLNTGLQAGVQFHYNDPFYYYKGHYLVLAFPVLGVINYDIPLAKNIRTGVSLKGGFSLFKVNAYIFQTHNASLFNIGAYADITKKLRFEIGLEQQNDYSSAYIDNPDGSFSELFKYRTKMNSINVGISYKLFH